MGQISLARKIPQNHRDFLSKVARVSAPPAQERDDMHKVCEIAAKVSHRPTADTPGSNPLSRKTSRQNPSSVNTVWGTSGDHIGMI